MTKRAERETETRRRITESAVELHGTLGPARTTISALAKHAGVQRTTVHRHFPDEAALFTACSSLWISQNPFPDLAEWAAIENPDERLTRALEDLYAHYRRSEQMMTNILRDEATLPILAQTLAGYRQYLEGARETLLAGRSASGSMYRPLCAVMGHALAFNTWRSLAGEQSLEDQEIVHLMRSLVAAARDRIAA